MIFKSIIETRLNCVFLSQWLNHSSHTLNTSQQSPTGNFLTVLNDQNTSGNSKTATPALQINGLSSQELTPTTIRAKDVIYA